MPNPSLLEQFCSDGQKDAVSTILQTAGWSPENPNINGYQLNTIFNEIFTYLNYLKNKGLSFWEDTKTYKATAGDIDIVRYANKIYFAKQDSNLDGVTPKTPDTNPTYWGVLYDLDKPLETTYALLGGSATQTFKVANAVDIDEAVNKSQLEKLRLSKNCINANVALTTITGADINLRKGDMTSDTINLSILGVGQTWRNVTNDRSVGTVYTNTTGKPIVVVIWAYTSDNHCTLVVDDLNIAVAGIDHAGNGLRASGTVIVPHGSTYYLKDEYSPADVHWHELR